MKELNLGLDIGTNSVGWALVDENGEVIKKNGFRFWGVRMFDESKAASERRTNRCSRRRLRRRKQRIELLQNEFRDEINKVDANFFQRINDSFYKIEDKSIQNHYTFFDDFMTDQKYFEKYPTIYHLRKHLIETDEKADIRMLYLAIHHIIKYRGHFLNENETFNPTDINVIATKIDEFNNILDELSNKNEDDVEYFEKINTEKANFYVKLQEIMIAKKSKKEKESDLLTLMDIKKSTLAAQFFVNLLVYGKTYPKKYSLVKEEDYQVKDIDFSSDEYETAVEEAKKTISELSEIFDFVDEVKSIADYYYLLKLLGFNEKTNECNQSISDAMIKVYDTHQKDLKELKLLIKNYLPSKYNECFRLYDEKINNYVGYVGRLSIEGKTIRFKHCSKETFEKYIKGLLDNIKDEKAQDIILDIKKRIDNNEYMPRQNNGQNTSIPMQLNLSELKDILSKQSKYYPFLKKSVDGFTTIDRIEKIFTYHLPYYVGPLSNNSKFSWIERTSDPIKPWNYEKVIDIDKTAEKFIQRMQNKCTYLHGINDYCLPKKSLLFSEYTCLQYLNKLKINGSNIDKNTKDKIFNDFFLKDKSPTKKRLKEFISSNFGEECNDLPEITCNMSSWIDFKEIYKEDFDKKKDNEIEEIIRDITLFEDKKILEKRLKEVYKLNDDMVKQIKGFNYKGYGSICRNLLELTYENELTGEVSDSIIDVMRNTNMNLQELILSNNSKYQEAIDKYNSNIDNKNDMQLDFKEYIDENLYVSPIMKRPLVQAYKIIEEIERIFKRPIDKYYIECARTNQAKKEATNSRYNHIKDLYAACSKEELKSNQIDLGNLQKKLEENQNKLQIDVIYLYFTQLGKCMYTLNNIDFDSLNNGDLYDIDHIYPRSLIKDDSISNRVLVDKNINQNKKNNLFLCQTDIVKEKQRKFYKLLVDNKLITKEKYRRLTETNVSENTLDGFVNRQLVATNQAVKGLIQVLKTFKKVKNSDIIYSKAENVSDFRNEHNFLKTRTANNFHHAHDAYLNVVIGRALNSYYEKNYIYNSNDVLKMQNDKKTLNPQRILTFSNITDKNGNYVWGIDEYTKKIEKYLYHKYDIHETTRTHTSNEMFSKTSISKAGEGTVLIKSNDKKLTIEKYGGIKSYSYCFYCIVKAVDKKNNDLYCLEAIPTPYKNNIDAYISEKYSNNYISYEIIKKQIPTNVVVKQRNMKYVITGKTGDRYLIKNANDRFFSKKAIFTIRKIDKYFEKSKFTNLEEKNNEIEIAPAKKMKNNKMSNPIIITKLECIELIEEIKKLYSKDIYSYSQIVRLCATLQNTNFNENFNLKDLMSIIYQILLLLKTNERNSADLTMIGLKKSFGILTISRLVPKMRFVSESITGYFEELIFEVPECHLEM